MSDLLDRVVLPLASPEDAEATCEALAAHDVASVLALHVVEKAGGAPDKASVEQREAYADEIFAVVTDRLGDSVPVQTRVAFGTDVAETIFAVADDYDATAVVISPRGCSRWIRLLTGDVAVSLVTETDRPVLVLPDDGDGTGDSEAGQDGESGESDGDADADRGERADDGGEDG